MTDEDQEQLCERLRSYAKSRTYQSLDKEVCSKAAEEIKRLAKENRKLRNRPLTVAPRVMVNGEIK